MKSFDYENYMLSLKEVISILEEAVVNKKPCSLARFGHTEVCIAYNTYPEWILGWNGREYSGSTGAPQQMQQDLQTALKLVDIAGLHSSYVPADKEYANLTKELLQHLDFIPRYICSAWITHKMPHTDSFWKWLKKYKVALVGRRAAEAVPFFQEEKGVAVVTTLTLEGYGEIDSVCEELTKDGNWQIALISAGLPARILVSRLAPASGRVAIDFGHALDQVIEGSKFNHDRTLEAWKAQQSNN
ncbi:hypothetical protein SD71_04600 [Cohnella kolymensis]|uniref:GT-D fold-like domain-containing protein n=1 Tax=Cohnella kolymensis TaxID=1590652 RepID=A0ABR5A7H4_9BACL|nr:GT-D fold domain-containing glycosyltransferase [Cohnella kolymensis]KIL36979.1 hypothetical protein SD71_04600 [Cohnella kolymensis]